MRLPSNGCGGGDTDGWWCSLLRPPEPPPPPSISHVTGAADTVNLLSTHRATRHRMAKLWISCLPSTKQPELPCALEGRSEFEKEYEGISWRATWSDEWTERTGRITVSQYSETGNRLQSVAVRSRRFSPFGIGSRIRCAFANLSRIFGRPASGEVCEGICFHNQQTDWKSMVECGLVVVS